MEPFCAVLCYALVEVKPYALYVFNTFLLKNNIFFGNIINNRSVIYNVTAH